MLPSAFDALPAILDRLQGGDMALFCDYDGTLTPIVARPELATLPDPMRAVLERLAMRMPVAIISGRGLEDIRSFVGIDSLYYAGNHGLESVAPGNRPLSRHGEAFRPALDVALRRLRRQLAGVDGVLIEDKGLTASVHYRLVADDQVAAVEQAVDEILDGEADLRKRSGKKVFELRPNIDWDKGRIVTWLCEQMRLDDPRPLYLGDDVTDEDAFAAVCESGVGIRIGEPRADTAATYQLDDPAAVQRFLQALVGAHGDD